MHFWRIFPKEAKLAPTSNSNLEASLRAILEAQSLGEKGGTFTEGNLVITRLIGVPRSRSFELEHDL